MFNKTDRKSETLDVNSEEIHQDAILVQGGDQV